MDVVSNVINLETTVFFSIHLFFLTYKRIKAKYVFSTEYQEENTIAQ
jgi:hypothetical protein